MKTLTNPVNDLHIQAEYLQAIAAVLNTVRAGRKPTMLGAIVTDSAEPGVKLVRIDLPKGDDYGPAQALLHAMGIRAELNTTGHQVIATGLVITIAMPPAEEA